MNLQELIEHSYGSEDCLFAGHEFDRQRALESIVIADQEGIGFKEFIQFHRDYLEKRGCSEEHIKNQIDKVKTLSNYFKND